MRDKGENLSVGGRTKVWNKLEDKHTAPTAHTYIRVVRIWHKQKSRDKTQIVDGGAVGFVFRGEVEKTGVRKTLA